MPASDRMHAGIGALLDPRSVAVVGASDREGSFGGECLDNLRAHGYQHRLVAVHPRHAAVRGVDCVPSLEACEGEFDAVVLAISAGRVLDTLKQAIAVGARSAIVFASGFGDGGPEGKAQEAELARIAGDAGIAVVGPNCLGTMNRHTGATLWGTYMKRLGAPGPVSIIAQSGSVAQMLSIDDRGLRIASILSTGNEAVVTSADALDYLADDSDTEVILLFIETIRDAAAFEAAVRRARAHGKRLAVLRNGRSETGSATIAGHTGGLAGDDAVYSAFFERLDIPRFNDLDTLLEAGAYLLAFPEPPGCSGLGVMTLSGGEAGLAADLADDVGLELPPFSDEGAALLNELLPDFRSPNNPMDGITLGFDVEGVRTVCDAMAGDTAFGTVAMVFGAPAAGGHDDAFVLDVMQDGLLTQPGNDTRLVIVNTVAALGRNAQLEQRARELGGVMLQGLRAGLEVISKCGDAAPPTAMPRLADVAAPAGLAGWDGLDEAARFEVMNRAGVPMVECRLVGDRAEAVTALHEWGRPVVLKGCAPDLVHKTEHSLVKTGLAEAAAVEAAFDGIVAVLGDLSLPGSHVVAQPMAQDGLELIVGVRNEPGFGPILVVGPGGLLVNLIGEASIHAVPISEDTAAKIVSTGRIGRLIDGHRGAGPFDRDAAARAIASMSEFTWAARHHISFAEINPLIVHADGASAVDIALSLREPAPQPGVQP